MLFNSYIFVFLFFPICLAGYYGLLHLQKKEAAGIFLTAMSFWFYGYFNVSYLLIMVCSIAGNYLFHRLLSRRQSKALVTAAVAALAFNWLAGKTGKHFFMEMALPGGMLCGMLGAYVVNLLI